MDLFVVDAAGGVPRRLTNTPRSDETAPVWSPDGSRIAFARGWAESPYTGKAAIFVVNRDGLRERLVVEHRLYSYTSYGLSWSPDGRTIAFETAEGRNCTVIGRAEVATGAVRHVTSCRGPFRASVGPAWQPSPDSRDAD
jgi:Tol biopolymer transport system component